MKFKRQAAILDIISKQNIETQDEITNNLIKLGFDITQATVSRDIRELKLIKTQVDNGGYKYASVLKENNYETRLRNIFRESVVSVDFAQNIVIIKSLPGLASAVASSLDTLKKNYILGSIAGDDTVFVLTRDENSAKKFKVDAEKMRG